MKKKSLIPKSKAKNAYELLDEVKALILEEPKRYNQNVWRLRGSALKADQFQRPACGTVACVAGWVATLKYPTIRTTPKLSDVARDVLGIDLFQEEQLFDASALYDVWCGTEQSFPASQTAAYAELGAKHIAAFQEKYAKQLKAKRV